ERARSTHVLESSVALEFEITLSERVDFKSDPISSRSAKSSYSPDCRADWESDLELLVRMSPVLAAFSFEIVLVLGVYDDAVPSGMLVQSSLHDFLRECATRKG